MIGTAGKLYFKCDSCKSQSHYVNRLNRIPRKCVRYSFVSRVHYKVHHAWVGEKYSKWRFSAGWKTLYCDRFLLMQQVLPSSMSSSIYKQVFRSPHLFKNYLAFGAVVTQFYLNFLRFQKLGMLYPHKPQSLLLCLRYLFNSMQTGVVQATAN